MSLLSPWFLAGLVLIGGPILAHLIRRATRERLSFSTLRFLDASAPRLDRRSRVQNPWLLALRCLIVAVLAFGFARPFLREQTPPSSALSFPRHVVAIIDESASMRRTGAWDAAREQISNVIARLGANDRFALLGAGLTINELIAPERWLATAPGDRRALVDAVLAAREPGWGPTPLDAAAEAALARWEDMTEASGSAAKRELVIVSDFGSGARTSGLANLAWPADTSVILAPISATAPGNASLHWLGWSEQDPKRLAARVRIARSFDAAEPVQLQWRNASNGEALGEPETLPLLPGGSEVRLVPVPEDAPTALQLELTGDGQPFDNTLWLVRPAAQAITISYLGDDAKDDPQHALFYLERAISGWREPVATLVNGSDEAATGRGLVVVTTNLDAPQVEALRARLESGAFALVLADRDELIATAATLAGESGWTASAPARPDALFGQLDFQHPLFSAFADPLYSDFTRIRFWQPHSVKLPAGSKAAVIARFDDDSPAVLEVPVGRGRVIVWGGGWTPAASQWVLSSKFVPWLQALAERASGGAAQPAIAELSEANQLLAPGAANAEWRRVGPDVGNAGSPRAQTPVVPGVYQLRQGDQLRDVALLVPAAESQLQPIPLDTWEQLGVPLQSIRTRPNSAPASSSAVANAITVENRQQMWRWLLWLAVALLALESVASFALSRRQTT